ncbi:hypothetical protein B0H13DRAFT_1910127 [Mycena leptocephala]|nr:hypothetical protein B0H13DRAFT_1910127 [Mycena leptocephala]
MSEKYLGLPIFNVERFKKYVELLKEFGERTSLSKTWMRKLAVKELIVEKIITHRFDKNRIKAVELGSRGTTAWQHDKDSWTDLWDDDVPFVTSQMEEAEILGLITYWVMDFQHCARRRLSETETPEFLHELYPHIVLESWSEQIMRVVFHQFHPKPQREALMSNGDIMDDEPLVPDLSSLRERFKGRCTETLHQSAAVKSITKRLDKVHTPMNFNSTTNYSNAVCVQGEDFRIFHSSAYQPQESSENPQFSPNPMDLRVSHSSAIEKQSESKGPQSATAQSQGHQANPQLSHRDLVAKYANQGGGVRSCI